VKERARLEEMYHQGNCPWMVWDPERSGVVKGVAREAVAAAAPAVADAAVSR
jgi:glucose-1-phosphate cytidylyltransferase